MKITKIKVKNFRLLKEFELDLEESLSLVIGKNNCGKTSLLSILNKFIGSQSASNNFSFDDFNSELKDELKSKVEAVDDTGYFGISLKLFIEYNDTDDLSNIGNSVIMDLDPDNKIVVLGFEYKLDDFQKLVNDYNAFKTKESTKPEELQKDFFYFMQINHKEYFSLYIKSIEYDNVDKVENDKVFIDLKKEKIQIDKIINFKMIDAKRNVSNKEPEKSLSSLSSKIYKKVEAGEEEQVGVEAFKDALIETDHHLDSAYKDIFSEVLEDVKQFGGIRPDDTNIKIVSTLQHRDLLDGNTTVMYSINDDHDLPESYNGLGYMNLISMIFEIKILIHEFKKELSEKPADINLLFIEEPEAHTHPQMQYIFIENIKSLLEKGIERSDGKNRKLQTVISTHSSHIASKSDFNDIKYFKKENNQVVSKNLKDLEKEYEDHGEEQNYKFLKQYLTLHRAELFFADKAIFIEGDTERILLPSMMKKIDQEDAGDSLPLLSQNISIVEVGAYAHIFEKFIDFIGVKSLVITDIDSAITIEKMQELKDAEPDPDKKKKITQKVQASDTNATITTNASLKFFYANDGLTFYISLTLNNKVLRKNIDTQQWEQSESGHLLCVYQTEEDGYYARSFEDAFFHINKEFVQGNLATFKVGIKNSRFINPEHDDFVDDSYVWAEKCVNKKPALAMEILLNSKTDEEGNQFSNWGIPTYIKEGLLWLQEN